jgi:hypothetical protein
MKRSVIRVLKAISKSGTTAGVLLLIASPAFSQEIQSTLRNPLVPGAYYADPEQQPMYPQPPAPGCAGSPWGVTPGMTGGPGYEPWVPAIPSNTVGITDSQVNLPLQPSDATSPGQFNQSVYGSIPNPPSTLDGTDPGMFPQKTNGYQAAAAVVNINSDGFPNGDQAPQQKWGGQTSKDFGRNYWNGQNSKLYDFGQKLSQNPNLAKQPQESQDGPRPFQTSTDYTTPVRQPQLTNTYGSAQGTSQPNYRTLTTNNVQAQQVQPNY